MSDEAHHITRLLRNHFHGVLLADSVSSRVRYICDPVTGAIVMPVERRAASAETLVLHVPDETSHSLIVMLERVEDASRLGAVQDRWAAYHGRLDSPHWVMTQVEAARLNGHLVDAGTIAATNQLAASETALLREARRHPEDLARVCEARLGDDPGELVIVGVDHLGMDVRSRIGVLRFEFSSPAGTPEEAIEAIRAALASPTAV